MHTPRNIEYFVACSYFKDAENKGLKLQSGNIETSIWLHKEKINLDLVIDIARNFPDSKTFIIAQGENKGFYIYSNKKRTCIKLENESSVFEHAESA